MDIKTVIELEKQRKRLKKSRKLWKILSYLVAFAVFGPMLALALIIIFLNFPKLDLGVESLFLLVTSILAIIGMRDKFYEWIFERKTERFLMRYKELYLKPYIESLGFSYKMGALFQEKEVRQSEIFDGFDRFRADELVYASADGVDFMFCDIRLEKDRGLRTYDMHTKDMVGVFIYHNFYKSIVYISRVDTHCIAFCSGGVEVLPNSYIVTRFDSFSLCETYTTNFRIGESNFW